jgi:hypothetical protein
MSTSSLISHRMFVASLTGGHRTPTAPRSQAARVFIEPVVTPPLNGALDEKRRREALSAIALRQVLSLGVSNVL